MQERIRAEREGAPFLLLRDADGRNGSCACRPSDRLSIGRGEGVDLSLDWDERVSRVHAELERVGETWALVDDGLSRNGSYVNGKRVRGRRRLEEGDELRLGGTRVVFRSPEVGGGSAATTKVSQSVMAFTAVSDAQRRVLVALCRPFADGDPWARPATNKQIAEELFLTVAGGQDAPARALRALRDRGPRPEREASAAGRARVPGGPGQRRGRAGSDEPSLGSLVAGRARRQAHHQQGRQEGWGVWTRRPPGVGPRGTLFHARPSTAPCTASRYTRS